MKQKIFKIIFLEVKNEKVFLVVYAGKDASNYDSEQELKIVETYSPREIWENMQKSMTISPKAIFSLKEEIVDPIFFKGLKNN